MPETYDPQKRTFIKKPEIKICPSCGQPIMPEVKPFNNHMNHYIANSPDAKPMVVNSDEAELEINGVKVYKINPKTGMATFPVKTTTTVPATIIPGVGVLGQTNPPKP